VWAFPLFLYSLDYFQNFSWPPLFDPTPLVQSFSFSCRFPFNAGFFIQVLQVFVAGTNSSPCAPLLVSSFLFSLMALQSNVDVRHIKLDFSQSTLFFDLSFQFVTVHLIVSVCTQFHHLLFGLPHSGLPC
jgi:hypothetical protein